MLCDQFLSLSENSPLNRFSIVVELVEVLDQRDDSFSVVGRQQFDGQPRLPQSTGCVDARGDSESDVFLREHFLIVRT